MFLRAGYCRILIALCSPGEADASAAREVAGRRLSYSGAMAGGVIVEDCGSVNRSFCCCAYSRHATITIASSRSSSRLCFVEELPAASYRRNTLHLTQDRLGSAWVFENWCLRQD